MLPDAAKSIDSQESELRKRNMFFRDSERYSTHFSLSYSLFKASKIINVFVHKIINKRCSVKKDIQCQFLN